MLRAPHCSFMHRPCARHAPRSAALLPGGADHRRRALPMREMISQTRATVGASTPSGGSSACARPAAGGQRSAAGAGAAGRACAAAGTCAGSAQAGTRAGRDHETCDITRGRRRTAEVISGRAPRPQRRPGRASRRPARHTSNHCGRAGGVRPAATGVCRGRWRWHQPYLYAVAIQALRCDVTEHSRAAYSRTRVGRPPPYVMQQRPQLHGKALRVRQLRVGRGYAAHRGAGGGAAAGFAQGRLEWSSW